MVAPCEWIARDEAEWRERRVVVSFVSALFLEIIESLPW
jgi:hypothetical protein